MKVTTEEREQCELLLTVEVEPKKERKLLEKAARKIARQVRIPGFRPGKAPYNVVVRRFGIDAVQQEVMETDANKLVQDAISEAELTPFAQISLDSVEWGPLTLKIKVPTEPVVELDDYRSIRLDYEPVEVTDEDVQEQLLAMQDNNAAWAPVERPAETGDMVTMSRVEKDGDEILAEEESVELTLDPPEAHEGHDHPDNITPLLGLSAGDTKTYVLNFSDTYDDARYAGKDITVAVEILSVKAKDLEPLDDEFAQSMGDFETLDAMKENIREQLVKHREQQQVRELGDQVISKILESATVKWPSVLEDKSIVQELERIENEMRTYGLTMESYFEMKNITKDEFAEQVREQVVKQFKRDLVLDKVSKLEKIEIGESEILSRAKYISDMSGGGEQFWRSILSSPEQISYLSNNLVQDKALERLAAIAKGEAPSMEEIEAAAADIEEAAESETDTVETPASADEPAPILATEAVVDANADEVTAVDTDSALESTSTDTEK